MALPFLLKTKEVIKWAINTLSWMFILSFSLAYFSRHFLFAGFLPILSLLGVILLLIPGVSFPPFFSSGVKASLGRLSLFLVKLEKGNLPAPFLIKKVFDY
jgi:hypothetical protein